MITRVRGTEDLLDLTLYNFFIDQLKKHLQRYNYAEIQTPILESTALFSRSLGEHTDVVSKEMYTFATEGGEHICLRPEATASIIRAFVENRIEQTPWKVYTVGPVFRRERPQKGRWRQFSQVSIELIGSSSIAQDAHFIKMLDTLYGELLSLENYVIKLNFLGCLDDRKAHKNALLSFLETHKETICATCTVRKDKNTLRVFDCKHETCVQLYQRAPTITNHLCTACDKEWKQLQELLSLLSVNVIHDPMLVRGLDYYNKTVFEFSSRDLGAQNAFCGGGRYSLGKEVGGKDDFPSIGVGIGIGRLLMLLETVQQKLTLPQQPALHVIIPMAEAQQPLALLLANDLYIKGLCCEVLLEGASVTNMMKKANKLGARFALIIGQDEQQQGTVSIKNMHKGETTVVKQSAAASFLKAAA